MKYIFMVAIATMLTACAYSSDVVKIGPDTYSVSGTAGSERGGKYGAKQVAIKEANAFCEKLHKQINVINVNVATVNDIGTGSADITFSCVP